ncbi:hypothetical protein ACNAW0_18870 [Micromonospora sp. SL1-18]|uniref:hypothetical protein n=1 Tax=Micromonospora sp. SL1-18 TaxID=3399128 RepID=UPI003A4D1E65
MLKLATYEGHLADLEKARTEFTQRMAQARRDAIKHGEPDDLAQLMEAAGVDEDTQWSFWYHQEIDIDEVLEKLKDHIAPSITEVVEEIFRDAMRRRPGKANALTREIWHARLVFCLRRLAAARSSVAINHAAELLTVFPEETQNVCSYLLSVVDANPTEVVRAVEIPLTHAGFLLGWQYGWLYRVLSRASDKVSDRILDEALSIMRTDDSDWLARIEAARLGALRGKLSPADANALLRRCPDAYRTDIFAIAARVEDTQPWANAFLDGAKQDALSAVVIDTVRAQKSTTASKPSK